MNAQTERPDIAAAYVQRIKDLVQGKRTMPAVDYPERDNTGPLHLSDLDLCLNQTYFRRTTPLDQHPPMSDKSALFFLRGRVIERAIAQETKSALYDGILCTADDIHPEYGLGEVKSTTKDSVRFDPLKSGFNVPHWITRSMGYCKALGYESINLVVLFLTGNWCKRGSGVPVDLKAWKIDFTTEELDANWAEIKRREALLMDHIETGPMTNEQAGTPDWMCKSCDWAVRCPAYIEPKSKK
jgi:hypothetical protein